MSLKPFLDLQRNGRLTPLLSIGAGLKSFYTLTFIAAAGESGLLSRLASGPMTFDSLAEFFTARGQGREALEAWLQMGVRLRLLHLGSRGYELRGLAKALALPENDAALAMVQEIAGLHHRLIAGTVPKIREGSLFTLADQDGELIARSSRILEAFQVEAIRRTFPKKGTVRLLEIGCGSGIYLKHAADTNRSLTALGVELQPEVAKAALANLPEWGLSDRVTVEDGDIRSRAHGERSTSRRYTTTSITFRLKIALRCCSTSQHSSSLAGFCCSRPAVRAAVWVRRHSTCGALPRKDAGGYPPKRSSFPT